MAEKLSEILELVGRLDDSPGEETPRERFRRFLKKGVTQVGQLRDYVEDCLRTSGEQYSRALQDLVNRLGEFVGFEVEFGRYQGVQGQVGYDGYWHSPTTLSIVVEVKTTEVYAIKTSALVGYIDQLIGTRQIPDWDSALGLYVVGRPDPQIRQLENAIVAEKRQHQLRIASVESLLSLAEMMAQYDVTHDDILAVIRPSGPTVDPIVDLMSRLLAQRQTEIVVVDHGPQPPHPEPAPSEPATTTSEVVYWLTPVKSDEEGTSEEVIRTLVGGERIYAFGARTPGRRHLKPGDLICFYSNGVGVVAHAKVKSKPEVGSNPRLRHPERYPYIFRVDEPRVYFDRPVVIDEPLRSQLDAFSGGQRREPWSWFVQATRRLTPHDFDLLTRR